MKYRDISILTTNEMDVIYEAININVKKLLNHNLIAKIRENLRKNIFMA